MISLRRPGYLGKRLLFVMSLSALSFQRILFFKIGQSGQVLFIFQDSLFSFFFPPFETGSHKPQTVSVVKDGLELQIVFLIPPKGCSHSYVLLGLVYEVPGTEPRAL